ncbi:hypothetical protein GCM10018955_23920 [Planomonospora venezuelensis]
MPWAQKAWRLGGDDTYPWAEAGVAVNTVAPNASAAVAASVAVLLKMLSSGWGGEKGGLSGGSTGGDPRCAGGWIFYNSEKED